MCMCFVCVLILRCFGVGGLCWGFELGVRVNVCGVVCVVEYCLFLASWRCLLCCDVVSVWGVVIFVLSVMRVVGGLFKDRVCVSSCICRVLMSAVHPDAIISAVICVICSLLRFASGDHMVETYSSMGLVMGLYVASNVSFCFPHVVDVRALSICIVLRAFVVVFSVCLLYVSLTRAVLIFWVDVHGKCGVIYL